jgi:prevent-host-death family protein
MDRIVPLTDAKNHLSGLVRESAERDVVLLRHGRPAAVLIGAERYEALIEGYEDALDRLSVHETADEPTVPLSEIDAAVAS